jgi:hypothetical protein
MNNDPSCGQTIAFWFALIGFMVADISTHDTGIAAMWAAGIYFTVIIAGFLINTSNSDDSQISKEDNKRVLVESILLPFQMILSILAILLIVLVVFFGLNFVWENKWIVSAVMIVVVAIYAATQSPEGAANGFKEGLKFGLGLAIAFLVIGSIISSIGSGSARDDCQYGASGFRCQ